MEIKNKKSAIAAAFIGTLAGILGLFISYRIWGDVSPVKAEGVISYLPPLIIVVLLYLVFRRKPVHEPGRIFSALGKGRYLIIAGMIVLILGYITIKREDMVPLEGMRIVYFILTCMATGVFEELLCRGFSQNILVEGYRREGESAWTGILLASVIFALLHFLNLVSKPELILGTIVQVIYTFSMGLYLGVIYFRTKSISGVILLHALFNFLGSFTEVITKPVEGGDISPFSALIQLAIMLPMIYFAKQLFRK